MNIEELLRSTISMGYLDSYFHNRLENRRGPEYIFEFKPFGPVYYNNLMMAYKGDIIELSLVMGSVTDMHKSAHRIAIALKGVEYEEYTEKEIVDYIWTKNPGLRELSKEEILIAIKEDKSFQPVEGRTVIQKSSTERRFFVINNKIKASTEIAVRCTCSDFYYAWAWYNADHGCLVGVRPPAYKRVFTTERGRFRTLKNPHKIPGMCKHVMLFLALLMRGGLIENLPTLSSTLNKNMGKMEMLGRRDISTLLLGLKEELKDSGELRTGFGN